ncbi:MAG: FecCD family ABC transporter permease [Caldisericaceae bacterium]
MKVTPTSSQKNSKKSFSFYSIIFLLVGANVALFVVSLGVGRYSIAPTTVIRALLARLLNHSNSVSSTVDTVIFDIRLPRIIAALLIGTSLSESGAAYQGIFDNPLVSPFTLGLSSGAGFGAALAMLAGANELFIQISAFIFAIISVILSIAIGKTKNQSNSVTLVLAGFIVSSLFTSLLSFLKYYADPYTKLPSIVFWLMGSLSDISSRTVMVIAPIMIALILALYFLRWKLNILSLGDEEALMLGENPRRLRYFIIFISTLLTSLSVSISGVIGWVGLVVPHIGRMLVGPDYRKLLPVTILLGSAYLLLIDDISRTITASEMPIGILTALIGTPIFIYIMWKGKYRW